MQAGPGHLAARRCPARGLIGNCPARATRRARARAVFCPSQVEDEEIVARWREEALDLSDAAFTRCIAELRHLAATRVSPECRPAPVDGAFESDGAVGESLARQVRCGMPLAGGVGRVRVPGDGLLRVRGGEARSGRGAAERRAIAPRDEGDPGHAPGRPPPTRACPRPAPAHHPAHPRGSPRPPRALAAREGIEHLRASVPRDEHPGSDGLVVDLHHPSLWPFISDLTTVLPGRETALRPRPEATRGRAAPPRAYMWLPADVSVSADGTRCTLASQVNGLPRAAHGALYDALEGILAAALPLMEATLTELRRADPSRMLSAAPRATCCDPSDLWETMSAYKARREREGPADAAAPPSGADSDASEDLWEDWMEGRRAVAGPEVPPFAPPVECPERLRVRLAGRSLQVRGPRGPGEGGRPGAPRRGAARPTPCRPSPPPLPPGPPKRKRPISPSQVITKIASIELTPEKPAYPGGTWHVEGEPQVGRSRGGGVAARARRAPRAPPRPGPALTRAARGPRHGAPGRPCRRPSWRR